MEKIAGLLLDKIGNYIIVEATMLMGVKDEIEDLRKELKCIQGYLKDVEDVEAEAKGGISKVLAEEVLDISYDVEDVLDSYNLKAEEISQRGGLMRLTNIIGEVMDTHNILSDIRTLKRRILDFPRKRDTYSGGNVKEPQVVQKTSSFRVRQLRRTRSIDQEELVVGFEDDSKILLAKLVDDDEDKKRIMISIVGMGGKGKTALARKLYNSDEVQEKFKYRAWTYVSQKYKPEDILLRIIRSLGLTHGEELEKLTMLPAEQLEDYLNTSLEGKKYLVVVDDIWDIEAWASLRRALPFNSEGSRVIFTTRSSALFEGMGMRVHTYMLRLLRFEESWKLFEHKAFSKMQWVEDDVQKIGKEMIIKCGGLPLAIVILAGLMYMKTPNEWNDVRDTLRLKNSPIHISTVFDLSFNEMSRDLKICFIYLSVFPEDSQINVEMLIHLLVAEGLIRDDSTMMMEDVARLYIKELIDRSLVEVVSKEREKVMSFKIHDLLRDMAIEKAKELNFVNVSNERDSSTTCRRLVVHHTMNEHLDRNVNMRSFLFFTEGAGNFMQDKFVRGLEFVSKLKKLRVLHLNGLPFFCKGKYTSALGNLLTMRSLPDGIGELIHLRYLGIANTGVEILPAFISNLRFLQTLDASEHYNYFKQKTDLSNLTSLRHVTGRFAGELLIGETVNLQTLKYISSRSWIKLKHEFLKNLLDLEIVEEFKPYERIIIDLASFSKLTKLRILKLRVKAINLSSFDMDLIFPSLVSLIIVGPDLDEDPMPALQKLSRLEDLVLKFCNCAGVNIKISAQGFSRLKKFELIGLKLDELHIEEEAMPSLVELNLKDLNMMGYNYLNPPRGVSKLMIPHRLRAFARVNFIGIGVTGRNYDKKKKMFDDEFPKISEDEAYYLYY